MEARGSSTPSRAGRTRDARSGNAGFASYRIVRRLFLLIAAWMFDFRVTGADHIPRKGGAVLVAAHRSWLDPACVGGACPRPVSFLILDAVYHKWWARWFYRRMRSIPVAPGDVSSVASVRRALRRLRAGELLGVFPEGRVVVENEPQRFQAGAALLAVRGGAPVIPVDIRGSATAWPHGRWWPGPAPVAVRIGPPIPTDALPPGRAVDEMTARIEAALDELRRQPAAALPHYDIGGWVRR